MLESIILINTIFIATFSFVLLNRKWNLTFLYGKKSKTFGIVVFLIIAFTVNMVPLVSADDTDGDGVENSEDDCPDTVTQDDWTVADNGCSYPSYLDNVWLCIGGGVTVEDLTGKDNEECSVTLSYDSTYMTITTPGIANHDMEGGPGGEINAQNYAWKLPLVPSNDTACNPVVTADGCEMAPERGPVATAVNGVPFYGPEDGPGGDAVALEMEMYEETEQVIDLGVCGAHSGPGGAYHYHFDGNCMHWHGDASDDSYDVSIADMAFSPNDLTISVGDTVKWTNNDGGAHTATATSGPELFNSGNLASGATWSFTFTEVGTYDYKCNYHDSMIASITVVEPEIVWADYDFSKANSTKHSPIIGFAFDGYPIYGAYGAVDGEITKMKSNYILKSGETGSNGIDDYVYSVDNGGHLDACNGVFGVTPEFPEGIYHYHSTVPTEKGSVTATNNAFPYFVNCYRGNAEDSNFDGDSLGGGGGPPDADGDHVGDGWDMCADTGDTTYPDGAPIYPRGCTQDQFDLLSSTDQNTSKVAYSGNNPPAPPDADGDGIPDPLDDCDNTESGKLVFKDGCNHGWVSVGDETNDTDGDGFADESDAFPDNSSEWADSDNDGVGDNSDACQNTKPGIEVDNAGCSNEQKLDDDKDNINNQDDLCPNEDSSGYDSDADGCIDDSDDDGVKNNVDVCPFDANDQCPSALQNNKDNVTIDVPGCIHQSAENWNPDATEDDGSCKFEEDSPGVGALSALIICFIISILKRKQDI